MRMRMATITAVLLLCAAVCHAGVILSFDDKQVAVDGYYDYGGHRYIEAVPALRAMGYATTWNEPAGKLLFKSEAGAGILTPYSPFAIYGAKSRRLSAPPVFLDGRFCVPEDFFLSALPLLAGVEIGKKEGTAVTPPAHMAAPYRPMFLKKVVIDAGHGGHDSGATSSTGVKEKDVNLAVAKRLARRLRDEMGIEVVLTREDDRFLTLGQRAQIGNTSGADFFLSIHSNGAMNKSATGTETFFVSFEASDRRAARLAEMENASIRFEEDNPMVIAGGDDLKRILWDMVHNETVKESEKLAIAVQEKLEQQLHLPSRGVKQAPFYVLMGTSIPAILVEIGFVTTVKEAELLDSPVFQERITDALLRAILHYDTTMAIKSGK